MSVPKEYCLMENRSFLLRQDLWSSKTPGQRALVTSRASTYQSRVFLGHPVSNCLYDSDPRRSRMISPLEANKIVLNNQNRLLSHASYYALPGRHSTMNLWNSFSQSFGISLCSRNSDRMGSSAPNTTPCLTGHIPLGLFSILATFTKPAL